ncbi:MAG TPA: RHS repeat-associated core domain-containing protein [Anaerolineaceae bacterium]|nr:RHS repeat-associated core domain-containing protein [Anaerolineaceae bacterium]HPN53987.1 RHS repeat-associated core domain-containing protein [Anaerolineaceae bacterium]
MQHIASLVTVIVLIANAVLPFGVDSLSKVTQAVSVPVAEKVESTPTPEPTSEAAATETVVPLEPTATPEVVPTETVVPAPEIEIPIEAPRSEEQFEADEGNHLTLTTDAEYVLPGQNITVRWEFVPGGQIDAEKTKLAFELEFPKEFIPQGISEEQILKDKGNVVHLDDFKYAGELTFLADEKARGKIEFTASVLSEKETLTGSSLLVYAAEVFDLNQKGGEIDALESKVQIRFPEGVMPEDASVRVNLISKQEKFSRNLGFAPFDIVATGKEKKEEIHKFEKPFTIEVAYDPEQVNGGEQTLNLFYYDIDQNTWIPIPSMVDVDRKVVVGTLDHLTSISLGKQDWETATAPTMKSFQVSQFSGGASYSYPLWVPPGPSGLQPSLSLSYSSQVVDSSNSRAQASWVGMGWSLGAGYIQRSMHATPDFWTKEGNDNDNGSDGDDTFNLTLNGASYELIRIQDQDNSTETIDYRTSDESFLRIRRYHSHGDVGGYAGGDTSYWLVWDKQGNKYEFQDRAYYPSKIYGASNCTVTAAIWRWSLTKVVDPKMGDSRAMTYTYNHQQQYNSQGCQNGFNMDMAVYLQTINYPDNLYYIRFDRNIQDRKDFDTAWTNETSRVLYITDLLTDVWIIGKLDSDHPNEETELKHYALGYSYNSIYTDFTWRTDGTGKTPALATVTEYGAGNMYNYQPVNFYYGDKMHLASATNGYGGVVYFNYASTRDSDPNVSSAKSSKLVGTHEGRSYTGEIYLDEYLGVPVGDLGTLKTTFQPGGYYKITVNVGAKSGTYQFKLDGGTGAVATGNSYAFESWGTYSDIIQLPVNARQARPKFFCSSCTIGAISVEPLVTINRVSSQLNVDLVLNTTTTVSYTYGNFRVNSPEISASAGTTNPYSEAWGEARGHSFVTVTFPDQSTATTWFYQDDDRKGQAWKVESYDANHLLVSRNETTYASDSLYSNQIVVPVSSYTDGVAVNPFTGMEINWTRPVSATSYSYDPSTTHALRNLKTYEYGGTLVNGFFVQMGEVTTSTTAVGDTSYTSWVYTNSSVNEYYGMTDASKYIVGLNKSSRVYECDYSTSGCNRSVDNLLTETVSDYDADGYLIRKRTLLDIVGNLKYFQDTTFEYADGWGNLTKQRVYPDKGSSELDLANPVVDQGTPLDTTFVYDDRFHTYLISETNPANQTTTWTYNTQFGLPDSETGPNGAATKIRAQYDTLGRLTRICKPGDGATVCDYGVVTGEGSYLQIIYNDAKPFSMLRRQWLDASNYSREVRLYSGQGLMIQSQVLNQLSDGSLNTIVTDYAYDNMGRLWKQSVPRAVSGTGTALQTQNFSTVTTTLYDARGRVSTVTDPSGVTATNTYSFEQGSGLLAGSGYFSVVSTTNGKGQTQKSYTDLLGRTVRVNPASSEGGTTMYYTYNLANQLTTVWQVGTDGTAFASTTISYDRAGRKVGMTDPDMGTWSYSYDPLGNMIRQEDALHNTICMYYDHLMRMKQKKLYPQDSHICPAQSVDDTTNTVFYGYDESTVTYSVPTGTVSLAITNPIGQRTSMSDARLSSTQTEMVTWSYDERGRVTRETRDLSRLGFEAFTTQFVYNRADMMTRLVYPDGEKVDTSYNRSQLPTGLNSDMNGSLISSLRYDSQGRMEKMQQGSGIFSIYSYYPDTQQSGRLSMISVGTDNITGGNLLKMGFTYDAVGNIAAIMDQSAVMQSGSQTISFGYDYANRLTSASASTVATVTGISQSFSYDQAGNLDIRTTNGIQSNYDYSPSHPHAATSTGAGTNYVYDVNGNMTLRTEGGITYTQDWTPDNRLKKVTWSQGSTTYQTTFVYDGDGNRLLEIEKTSTGTVVFEKTTAYIGGIYEKQWDSTSQLLGNQFMASGNPSESESGDVVSEDSRNISENVQGSNLELEQSQSEQAALKPIPTVNPCPYPRNPTWVNETHSVANGVWQNFDNAPSFRWGGACLDSGVDGYYVYFGTDPNGTSTYSQSGTTFSASTVTQGTYYLRIKTYNIAYGEFADWATKFTFRYDTTNPIQPTGITESHGVANNGWTTLSAPTFNWTGASDNLSGVSKYYVYWGADSAGENNATNQSGSSYSPTNLSYGIYYLRLRTMDAAGNKSGWSTYFVYRYSKYPVLKETKYYLFGGKRVAVKQMGGEMTYIATDHLGSASLLLTSTSTVSVVAQTRYNPFGEVRWSNGATSTTDFGFTGQRTESGFGLMDYGARFYSSTLGRFISPDTIIPVASQGNGAFDRYAYVNNNPLKFVDISGHDVGCSAGNPHCADSNGITFQSHIAETVEILFMDGSHSSLGTVVDDPSLLDEPGNHTVYTHNHYQQDSKNYLVLDSETKYQKVDISYPIGDPVKPLSKNAESRLMWVPDPISNSAAIVAPSRLINDLKKGDIVEIIFFDDMNSKITSIQGTISDVSNLKIGAITVITPINVINKGDSGGGVYFNGLLVGNIWSVKNDGISVALYPYQRPQNPPHRNGGDIDAR